jgi:ribosomal protein S18 acetylase RimI-like enzyme
MPLPIFTPLLDPSQVDPHLSGEDFEIHPVGEVDMAELLELYRLCEDFLAMGPVPHASEEMVRSDLRLSKSYGGIFCGIFDTAGVMLGVLDLVTAGFEGDPGFAYIELLMIAAPWRSRGLGSRVMALVEADLCRNPYMHTIRAGVQVNNPLARRFWQRQGFREISLPELLPDGTTCVQLEKRLPSSVQCTAEG